MTGNGVIYTAMSVVCEFDVRVGAAGTDAILKSIRAAPTSYQIDFAIGDLYSIDPGVDLARLVATHTGDNLVDGDDFYREIVRILASLGLW
jgi:hypothetical protein